MKSAAVVVALLFGFGVAEARPERVDWSEYLETKSDKPLRVTSTSAPKPKAEKEAPKKVAKAKAKAPGKGKKRTAARAKKRR